MPNPRLAARYAKALLDLAVEKEQLEQVYADMQWLQAACKGSRDFLQLLRSPIVRADIKKKAVAAVSQEHIGDITRQFSNLLISKNREAHLPEIANAFVTQYKAYKNIHTATLTTATPVSQPVKEAIVEKVKKESGQQHIELIEKINPDIIGGFILEMGDKMINASIAYDLAQVSKQFSNNDFVYKVR